VEDGMGFSWLPEDDRQQRVRFVRYLIAAGTSLLMVALLAVAHALGLLPATPFAVAAVVTFLGIAAFYLVFRTGLNRRARDPSLTAAMMAAATCVVTYSIYHAGPGRGALLLVYPMIVFFGVFRMDVGALLGVAALNFVAYALVLVLLAREPSRLEAAEVETMRAVALAAVLVWFALMGGYVHELRNRLRRSGFDALTGSLNRSRVLELLEQEKTRCDRGGAPFCVCLADIDGFKGANDLLGHHGGDRVLQAFAEIAQAELRAIDAIGRYGGDEFVLVLTQTSLAGARECAERVRSRTEQRVAAQVNARGRVTVSIGLAQYCRGETLQNTLHRADVALYRAKTGGRNRIESDLGAEA
jgi:diguanylate cyclase (GGDEF)-like protein